MDPLTALKSLGVSLALGMLVGLQRERAASALAGIRTFPLITIFGAVCAMLAGLLGGWVFPAGLIAVAAAMAMGTFLLASTHDRPVADEALTPGTAALEKRAARRDPGITTEIAILLMFGVGGLTVVAPHEIAVAVAVGCAILLHAKGRLHTFAAKIGDADVRAILQFAVIAFVVLPLLPDENFGPIAALNPRQIWMMVVLVVALSLAAYIAYKALPPRCGLVFAALLGGLVSSTATTASSARQCLGNEALVRPSLFVIVAASSVMFARLLVEIFAVAPGRFAQLAPPIAIMLGVGLTVALVVWRKVLDGKAAMPPPSNPTQLRSALFFGVVYAVVLVAVAAAREYIGERGIYAVAAISGLTDMDAITLSAAKLAGAGSISPDTAWRAILLASVSNLVFKAGIVFTMAGGLGGRLFRATAGAFSVIAAAAVALMLFWP